MSNTTTARSTERCTTRYDRTLCTLGAFARHTTESEYIIRNVFADALATPVDKSDWCLRATEPNPPYEPIGTIAISHPDFNAYTSVIITSTPETTSDGEHLYTIHEPMETDIRTHGEHLPLKDAIMNAGEAARSARARCKRTTTRKQHALLQRLTSVLYPDA